MKTINCEFHHDAGHGWLRVMRSQVNRLGIAHEISSFSYQMNGILYLEEDCDAPRFLEACQDAGITVEHREIYDGLNSPIRDLPAYTPR